MTNHSQSNNSQLSSEFDWRWVVAEKWFSLSRNSKFVVKNSKNLLIVLFQPVRLSSFHELVYHEKSKKSLVKIIVLRNKRKREKLDSSSSGNIFKKLDLLILWTCHEFYSKKIKLKSCSFFKLQKCHCLTKNHPKQVRRQMERRLSVKTTATNHINCNSSKLSQRQSRIPHRRRQV